MPDKIYSIQPRFKPPGDQSTGGWAWVDSLFNWGLETVMPIYPSPARDMYLGQAWRYEPVLAGAVGTAVDKMASSDWSIKGGRNTVNRYASLCHKADGGAGWAHMVSELYQDYISTNRGAMMELGRSSSKSRTGPVLGLQHMDSTRVMYTGDPNKPWRYLPVPDADGSDLWAENIIQIVSMPSPRDRFRGSGLCAVERLRDSIELMVGWLTHDRQMVGNLPPEALLIINGLDKTRVDESLQSYKARREAILKHQSGADPVYAGFWMLGNSNPANNVTAEIVNLRRTDQYDRNGIYEWWVKLIALNLGQSVGEFWLIQHAGATKAVEGIQAAMQSSKGVGRFAQELEWQLNTRIFKPANVTFSFDTQDELADAGAAEILATNVDTLLKLSQIADPMGSPALTLEELKQLAVEWGIIEPEMIGEKVPMQIGAKLKEFAQDDVVRYGNDGSIRQVRPLVGPAMREQFKELAGMLEDAYSVDKHLPGKHDQMTHGNWAHSTGDTKQIIGDMPKDMRKLYERHYMSMNEYSDTDDLPKVQRVELAIRRTVGDMLEGNRTLEEASETAQSMDDKDVRFTAMGSQYGKRAAVYAVNVARQHAAFNPFGGTE